ncbi:MAG: hypothetical protein KGM44_03255 [bacterium]|nr:hypothetical protein [bacterium]
MANTIIVHDPEGIQRMLRHGLAPVTDNRQALMALGFAAKYPNGRDAYERGIWSRSVDHGYRSSDFRRMLVEQIAHLIA